MTRRAGRHYVQHYGPCVVLADDSDDLRELLALTLDATGSIDIVGEGRDGREAVDLCRTLHPDVLVLDLAMPRMDGLEAIPLVRRNSPETRIMVLSGFEDPQVKSLAFATGAHAFVDKGEDAAKIAECIFTLVS
jgi:DNA-binding NarL/FixJ family response regulator